MAHRSTLFTNLTFILLQSNVVQKLLLFNFNFLLVEILGASCLNAVLFYNILSLFLYYGFGITVFKNIRGLSFTRCAHVLFIVVSVLFYTKYVKFNATRKIK